MRRHIERGAALLELAIIAPSLLFISLTAFDTGMIIRNYFVLAQTVRESVRQGGSVPYLEPGTSELSATSASTWVCNGGGGCPSQQTRMLLRARDILQIQSQALDILIPGTRIISRYDVISHTLEVRIETTYRGLFPPFAGMTIASTATGPYT